MSIHDFRVMSYPVRVYSGHDALTNLKSEVVRSRGRRAFIVCGRSVSRKTALIERMRERLGELCAGVYDEMEKDSPLGPVLAARDAAAAAEADLVIAVGGGSVIQATRVVVILLAEKGEVHELCTQYPEGRPAQSVKLLQPKLPIINVCTTPTSAMNRAGSGIKDPAADHRLEFFDPKTRPVSLYWDAQALLSAPAALARSSSLSVYWRSVMNLGAAGMNPLVEGDRLQAYRLAARSVHRVGDPQDAGARIDMCAAAFLHNRDQDDGGNRVSRHWVQRAVYAFATAIFNRYPHVGQGEANAALTPHVLRKLGQRDPLDMCRMAQGLGVWQAGMREAQAPARAADHLAQVFERLGMPARLRDLDVPQAGIALLVEDSMKNFNADPKREFLAHRSELHAALEACW
ncbi:MAG: iron-containing alcohol dehydrogenase [Burkholderiales bacterium]|nr:iron-containing alcohol dehydrogenase [Burkholderiales bacterium]